MWEPSTKELMLLNCGVREERLFRVPWTARRSVNPKRNQSWIFTERTDAEAEAPILWPPDVKSQLIRKDPDAGKDWRQEEKRTTEDEMVGWHHWLNRHEFEQTLLDDGQGSLVCYSPWGRKESDTTEQLNWLTDGTSASGPRSYSSLISVDRSCTNPQPAGLWVEKCRAHPRGLNCRTAGTSPGRVSADWTIQSPAGHSSLTSAPYFQ